MKVLPYDSYNQLGKYIMQIGLLIATQNPWMLTFNLKLAPVHSRAINNSSKTSQLSPQRSPLGQK